MTNSNQTIEIYRKTSINGRGGISIIGPEDVDLCTPQEGRMTEIGEIEGHECFQFIPEAGSGKWFLVGDDLEPASGCETVAHKNLKATTIVVGGDFFSVRRGSDVACYKTGRIVKVPAPVLIAMGVLKIARKITDI